MTDGLTQVPGELFSFLQVPRLVQLTTLEQGTGAPFVNTLSWVLAHTPETLRFMGDGRTRFIQNLKADPRIALTVLGAGSAWTIYGRASLLTEGVAVRPLLRLDLVEVAGLQIYPSLFYGAELTQPPLWEATYPRAEAERLDAAVFAAMRDYGGEDQRPTAGW